MTAKTENPIDELKGTWTALFPNIPSPDDSQWTLWTLLYSPAIIQRGIVELAVKHRKLHGQMTPEYMGKFASSVMNRLSREASHQ